MTEKVKEILAFERHRGSYRMSLLACVDAYNEDLAWLRRRIAGRKRVHAARIRAGHTEEITADTGLAEFERRWRVRVDVSLGAARDDLYIYDDSVAIAARPLTEDLAWHLARRQPGPDRVYVLDRRAPRRAAEPVLPVLAYRKDQERLPTFRPGTEDDLDKDRVIVAAGANDRDLTAVAKILNPRLAADVGYVAGARRPPTSAPSTLTRAQRAAWKWNLDAWKTARREAYRRWETLKPWVEPVPNSVAMRDWTTAMRTADCVQDDALVFTHWDEATGPVLQQKRRSRQLLPGESAEPPTSRESGQRLGAPHRQSAKTNKRR